jgi:hypothetical protein
MKESLLDMLFYCKLHKLKPVMLLTKKPLDEQQFAEFVFKTPSVQLMYAVPQNQVKIKYNIILMAFTTKKEEWYSDILIKFDPLIILDNYKAILTRILNILDYKKINFEYQFCYWSSQLFVGDLLDLLIHLGVDIPTHWNNLDNFHKGYNHSGSSVSDFNLNAWAKTTLSKKVKKDFREIFLIEDNTDDFGFK